MALRALQGPTGGGSPVGGTGTTNTIPRWTGPSTLGDSGLIDNGTAIYTTTRNVGFGTASPGARLDVSDTANQLRATVSNATPAVTTYALGTREGYISARQENSGSFNVFTDIVSSTSQFTPSGLRFFTHASGDASISERARIDSAGRILQGVTATPSFTDTVLVNARAGYARSYLYNSAASRGIYQLAGDVGGPYWELGGVTGAIGAETLLSYLVISSNAKNLQFAQPDWGLKLPATPGNADTQTLDAYKEGTFTATLKGGTSDPTTPVTVTGNYVLVGKTMTVTVYFANVTTTGAAGNVYVTTDLAAALRPGTRGTAAVGLEVFTTGAGVGSLIDVRTDGTFYLLENFNNGTSTIGQHNAGTNRYLWFTATYIIA